MFTCSSSHILSPVRGDHSCYVLLRRLVCPMSQAKVGKRKARLMDLPMDEPEDVVVPAKVRGHIHGHTHTHTHVFDPALT